MATQDLQAFVHWIDAFSNSFWMLPGAYFQMRSLRYDRIMSVPRDSIRAEIGASWAMPYLQSKWIGLPL
jgi:hypothetical protein